MNHKPLTIANSLAWAEPDGKLRRRILKQVSRPFIGRKWRLTYCQKCVRNGNDIERISLLESRNPEVCSVNLALIILG